MHDDTGFPLFQSLFNFISTQFGDTHISNYLFKIDI